MNTEATQEKSVVYSIGERLRLAREQMGFTQQNIAERLCLKLSIVRDIEEDKSPIGLELTFLRGYIRSYARLVHVPENDLFPVIATKQSTLVPIKKNEKKLLHLLKKSYKKTDRRMIFFAAFIILIIISLTSSWWWKDHNKLPDSTVSVVYEKDEVKNSEILDL